MSISNSVGALLFLTLLFFSDTCFSQRSSKQKKLYNQFTEYQKNGNFRGMINVLDQIIYEDSLNEKLYYVQALCYAEPDINRLDSAAHSLTKAIKLNDTSVTYHFKRGCYVWGSNPTLALSDFYRTIELDPDFYEGYEKLHTYYIFEDTKKAAAVRRQAQNHFKERVNADSLNARKWFLLGKSYDMLDDQLELQSIKDKCLMAYSKAIELDQMHYEYYEQRAFKHYWSTGNYDACIDDMTHALALNENWFFRDYIIRCYEKKGDFAEALKKTEEGLILYPTQDSFLKLQKTLKQKLKNQ